MLWTVIYGAWCIMVAVSFLVSCGMSAFALLSPDVPISERVGTFFGIWLRWAFGLVSGVISLLVLWFVLGFVFGVRVPGMTFEPR